MGHFSLLKFHGDRTRIFLTKSSRMRLEIEPESEDSDLWLRADTYTTSEFELRGCNARRIGRGRGACTQYTEAQAASASVFGNDNTAHLVLFNRCLLSFSRTSRNWHDRRAQIFDYLSLSFSYSSKRGVTSFSRKLIFEKEYHQNNLLFTSSN